MEASRHGHLAVDPSPLADETPPMIAATPIRPSSPVHRLFWLVPGLFVLTSLAAACGDDAGPVPTDTATTADGAPDDADVTPVVDAVPDAPSPDLVDGETTPTDMTVPPDAAEDISGDVTEPEDLQGDVPPDVPSDVSGPGETLTLTLPAWQMAPGEERTRCVVLRLDNTAPILVDQIRTTLARGSHHFIVYRSDANQERREPFDCQPFTDTLGGGTVPLMISQVREETLDFPSGVAVSLAAGQMIRLEAHFLNYFPETIDASAEVSFRTTNAPGLELADFMFYGTTQVFIPAGQTVTSNWKFHSVPDGVKVFGMTGHTHALGTNVEVQRAASVGASGTALYPPDGAPFDWAEAPYARFEPPLELGGDGFRMRCTWTNTTGADVGFGESANQEMCFFWAYYYPSQGFLVRFL